MKRNLGKFYINLNAMDDSRINEVLTQLDFIPVKVDYSFDVIGYEYTGFSPLFRETLVNEAVPEYHIKFIGEDGKIEVSVTEVKIVNEIKLGTGQVLISSLLNDEKESYGILFRSIKEKLIIGKSTMKAGTSREYSPENNDTIIKCNNLDSAIILQDAVNKLVFQLAKKEWNEI